MNLLDGLVRLVDSLFAPATATRCPLCAGTDRSSQTYDSDQLAEHAVHHDAEDLYDFARGVADTFGDNEIVGMLDAAYDVLVELTTGYFARFEPDESDATTTVWRWLCHRCSTSTEYGFPSQDAARRHRIATHRCPA